MARWDIAASDKALESVAAVKRRIFHPRVSGYARSIRKAARSRHKAVAAVGAPGISDGQCRRPVREGV
jgi:hypothetical protein